MTGLRSPRLNYLLRSYRKVDRFHKPKRLQQYIPMSADLLWRLLDLIDEYFAADPDLALWYRAAVSLAYIFGERPGEYSTTHSGARQLADADADSDSDDDTPTSQSHLVKGGQCKFQFSGHPEYFPVTDPAAFPPSTRPEAMFQFLDCTKNHPSGSDGPFCIAEAPLGARFDCLGNIFSFVRRFPPRPSKPLLSGFPRTIPTTTKINAFLKVFARRVGLNPAHLSCHSFRVGHTVQTESMSDIDQFMLSGHASFGGKIAYCRDSLDRARRAAPHLYDISSHPLESLQQVHGR